MTDKSKQEKTLLMTRLMTPDMSNFSGKVHGGTILKLLDEAAFTCASRYCKTYVVTKSLDQVEFKNPIEVEIIAISGIKYEISDLAISLETCAIPTGP